MNNNNNNNEGISIKVRALSNWRAVRFHSSALYNEIHEAVRELCGNESFDLIYEDGIERCFIVSQATLRGALFYAMQRGLHVLEVSAEQRPIPMAPPPPPPAPSARPTHVHRVVRNYGYNPSAAQRHRSLGRLLQAGFVRVDLNLRALEECHGDEHAAMELLRQWQVAQPQEKVLMSPPPPPPPPVPRVRVVSSAQEAVAARHEALGQLFQAGHRRMDHNLKALHEANGDVQVALEILQRWNEENHPTATSMETFTRAGFYDMRQIREALEVTGNNMELALNLLKQWRDEDRRH